MKKKKDNKSIKCNVESCIYNDNEREYCELDEIKVTSDCDEDACDKCETICDSFEKKDDDDMMDLEEEYEAGREYYEEVEDYEDVNDEEE